MLGTQLTDAQPGPHCELARPIVASLRLPKRPTGRMDPTPRRLTHPAHATKSVTVETLCYSVKDDPTERVETNRKGPKLSFLDPNSRLRRGRLCAPEVHVAHVPRTVFLMDLETSDPLGEPIGLGPARYCGAL